MYDIERFFTVKSLKALCAALGVPVSGAKGVLQQRLRASFLRILNVQDTALFNIGKAAAEIERGRSYATARTGRYCSSGLKGLMVVVRMGIMLHLRQGVPHLHLWGITGACLHYIRTFDFVCPFKSKSNSMQLSTRNCPSITFSPM